jgi:DNA-binding winged helix-turn-helix (wHTH) protein
MSQIPGTSYEFGPFQLDAVEQLLRHDGREIALTPKAFAVLLLLVRNPGHVLTKDDFLREVWADSVVEEKNLTDNISILRHALGDDPREPKYIRTVPRRGYRFVGEVTTAGNGVELLLAEHTRARVVIEEQQELPVVAEQKQIEGRRFSPKAFAFFSTVGVIALVAAGIVWYRQYHRSADSPLVLLPAHLSPLTSFPDEEVSPALSPDGKFVAYSWKGGTSDRMNIYVQQVDAGTPLRLTTNPGREGAPSWSPDGRYLSFIRGDPDSEKSGLYIIPAFGGHERLLTNRACGADWSPDGKFLVVTMPSDLQGDKPLCTTQVGLRLLNMETLETQALTVPPQDSNDNFAKFSPDGKSVAFLRSRADASELFVVPSQGGDVRQLTFDKRRPSGGRLERRQPRNSFLVQSFRCLLPMANCIGRWNASACRRCWSRCSGALSSAFGWPARLFTAGC